MKLCILNPNTSAAMTAKIGAQARRVASPGTQILAVNPTMGPASIESHYDDAVAVLGVLEEIRKAEAQGCDGYVIACFGDPGLRAAREAATGPVIGIAEAAMHAASFLATGFSVVTTLTRTCVIAEHLAQAYGMNGFCRNIHGTDIPVLDLEGDNPPAYATIRAACKHALAVDRSAAIVLGCAGMSDLAARLSGELGVPVIDGVGVAVRLVESLVALNLSTSKRGDYAPPLPKPYVGLTSGFAWPARHA